jgi:hypothetical protein
MEYAKMVDILPEGHIGSACVRHIEVPPDMAELTRLRALINNRPRDYVPAGRYAQLYIDGELYMSDTPTEQRENNELIQMAYGSVLIAGLGLGMVLVPLLANPNVTSITVVEISQDVIDLVGPHFTDPRLKIVQADFLKWTPPRGARWDTIYFDIWPTINPDDTLEVSKLRRRYRRRLNKQGWMGEWAQAERRAQRRVEVALVHSRGYCAADIPLGENPVVGLKRADARRGGSDA